MNCHGIEKMFEKFVRVIVHFFFFKSYITLKCYFVGLVEYFFSFVCVLCVQKGNPRLSFCLKKKHIEFIKFF